MTFKCSRCGTTLDAPDLKSGDICECPNCSETVEVPHKSLRLSSRPSSRKESVPCQIDSNDSGDEMIRHMREQTQHLAAIHAMLKLFMWIFVVLPLLLALLWAVLDDIFG